MQVTHIRSLGWTIPRRREWLLTPVFLPKEFHAQRSLASYNPRGCKESDMNEQLTRCGSNLNVQGSKSDRGKQVSYDVTYLWNFKKRYKWTYLQNRNRHTNIENKLMVTNRINQEFGISVYTQLHRNKQTTRIYCIKQRAISCIMEKNLKKNKYIINIFYICSHFDVHLKLTQYCKLITQFKKGKKSFRVQLSLENWVTLPMYKEHGFTEISPHHWNQYCWGKYQ